MQIQAIETFIKGGGWGEEMSCDLQEQEGKDFTIYLSRKELEFSFQTLYLLYFSVSDSAVRFLCVVS